MLIKLFICLSLVVFAAGEDCEDDGTCDRRCSDLKFCVQKAKCVNPMAFRATTVKPRAKFTARLLESNLPLCALGQVCCPGSSSQARLSSDNDEGTYEQCGSGESCVETDQCTDESINDVKDDTVPRMKKTLLWSPRIGIEKIGCGLNKICCQRSDDYAQCGIRKPTLKTMFDARILTGDTTTYGEFPWMILILSKVVKRDVEVYERLCGGSLILPHVVLTAAHSIQKLNEWDLKARAGDWNLVENTDEMENSVEQDVLLITEHELYDEKNYLANDIALLTLRKPFELSQTINVICLPPQGMFFDLKRCTVIGWGKNSYDPKGDLSNILKKVNLPIVPHGKCETQLKATGVFEDDYKLHDSFICAGGILGEDSCTGDGGSPLMCPVEGGTEDQYYQAGIVSWGIGCGEKDIPGAYVNVAAFRNWIDSKVEMGKREYAQVNI